MITQIARVVQNKMISQDIYKMTLKGEFKALPGQFINIKLNNERLLLRRPISIFDATKEQLEIIYRVVGEGTKELSETKENDTLDILGPVGSGFPLTDKKKVLIIGGGIGVPPLHLLAKELVNKDITFVLGFRNKENIILKEELEKYGRVIITTDDGS